MRWIQVQSNRTGSVRVPPARGQPEEVERFPPERQRVLNPGIHQGGGAPHSAACASCTQPVYRGGHPDQAAGTPSNTPMGVVPPIGQARALRSQDIWTQVARGRRIIGRSIGGRGGGWGGE